MLFRSVRDFIKSHNDWDAWWTQVADLPHLNEPIIMAFDEIPHTATMKVQRLQLEKWLKEQ